MTSVIRGSDNFETDDLLGIGQTYQNVTASRALNTLYTNTTSRPIFVTVSQTTGNVILVPSVGGVDLAGVPGAANSNVAPTTFFIVPPGLTYQVKTSGAGPVLNQWVELR